MLTGPQREGSGDVRPGGDEVGTAGPHVPGEAGIWVFVLGDMAVFALFFVVFAVERAAAPEVFAQSSAALDGGRGLVNTLLLLTSSLLVARAGSAIRAAPGDPSTRSRAAALLVGGAACGTAFALHKIPEYWAKVESGIGVNTNEFYTLYFLYTGIHLVHVLIGLAVLTVLWRAARRAVARPNERRLFESGATYWHMVDVLWVVLFPLLYLLG